MESPVKTIKASYGLSKQVLHEIGGFDAAIRCNPCVAPHSHD